MVHPLALVRKVQAGKLKEFRPDAPKLLRRGLDRPRETVVSTRQQHLIFSNARCARVKWYQMSLFSLGALCARQRLRYGAMPP